MKGEKFFFVTFFLQKESKYCKTYQGGLPYASAVKNWKIQPLTERKKYEKQVQTT
ncbi:MAG: hypothetical protein IKA22_09290 [Lentisphaeria bacterium]|nr:hypothetical protein [Lentisphaeria bacterium]